MQDKTKYITTTLVTTIGSYSCCYGYTVEPVYSDTPRDQENVSECTGCRNTQVLY